MNSFYASVELLSRPELAMRPVAVCGNPDERHGIILAKNDSAKSKGVVTAETIWQACKKCPDLVLLPPHMDLYESYSKQINSIYTQYTDRVEPFSIDESWLDVTGSSLLFGSGIEIAREIKTRIKKELGLTLSIGVSFNKIFAKLGSDYKKPDAVTCIDRGNFKRILWPLPASRMLFVGEATEAKLLQWNIRTIGDLACCDEFLLGRILGKQGPLLKKYALGLDESPVLKENERPGVKSIGNSITYPRDLSGEEEIRSALLFLSDKVASRLRKHYVRAGGLRLEIKSPDFQVTSRQMLFPSPVNTAEELLDAASGMCRDAWGPGRPVRLFQLTAIHLTGNPAEEQLDLFGESFENREKSEAIGQTLDKIRNRFGGSSIGFGALVNPSQRKEGEDVPDEKE